MRDDATLSYDPGYAAGVTLRRSSEIHTEVMCEQGLTLRLESWASAHFARAPAGPSHRQSAREYFRTGFRDGYRGRTPRRVQPLERVA